MKTEQISYLKVSENRGNKRIWIEGKRLATCGFNVGSMYFAEIDDNEIKLVLNHVNSDRKVSGRKRKGQTDATPIIDICSAELTKALGDANRIRVVFGVGMLTITIHHEDKDKQDREQRFNDGMSNGTLKEGTLCAGGGVATMAMHDGLKAGGINAVCEWIVDREGKYLQVALDNNPVVQDATIFEASLEELEHELLSSVDIMQFSLPCTGHSKSGKAKNKNKTAEQHDTDATALLGLFPAIKSANPAVIVSENVVEAQNSSTYDLIRAGLKRLGYRIEEFVLNELDAGTLERRTRWWFVAISEGLKLSIKDKLEPLQRIHQKLSDILDIDSGGWSDNQYLKDKAVSDAAAGKGFAKRQLLTGGEDSCGTIGRHYNKRRSTEPFIVNEVGQERLLTPVEHARVKRIPTRLVDNVPATTAHEILGQSILYGHMFSIALAITK